MVSHAWASRSPLTACGRYQRARCRVHFHDQSDRQAFGTSAPASGSQPSLLPSKAGSSWLEQASVGHPDSGLCPGWPHGSCEGGRIPGTGEQDTTPSKYILSLLVKSGVGDWSPLITVLTARAHLSRRDETAHRIMEPEKKSPPFPPRGKVSRNLKNAER